MEDWQQQLCRVLARLVDKGLYGWEDCAVLITIRKNDLKAARRILLRLDETRTAPGRRGAKAGPADGLPSLPAGPDIRRQT